MNPSPVNAALESVLLSVSIQLVVIIAAARISASLFRRLGQPMVCGEIAAGLILGPSPALLGFAALVLAAAVFGKMGGCTIAARLSGMKRNEALMVGAMMNTRALMELIVINIGYDLGIVPKSVFFMLVFMAVFTTYMTTPILRRLVRHTEVWESYRLSAFAARFDKAAAASV